jgi:uncharacterized protein
MTRAFCYQDPVHGAIEFPGQFLNSYIRNLVDCVEVQRLRRIRQNGLANFVFHGMEHSRFAHSMGVAYVARRMYDRIILNENIEPPEGEKLMTVVAALLHDVGHGPFSHTLEEILNASNISFSHENVTVRILQEDTQVAKILAGIDSDLSKNLSCFIDKSLREKDHWTYKLVSSQLDADRLDYLKRDAQMAGLSHTDYDLTRLLSMLCLHPEQPTLLAVNRGAIEAVESYLLVLDQMYRAVYFHKAVRAATVLFKSVLRRAIDLFLSDDKNVFPPSASGEAHPLTALIKHGNNVDLSTYIRMGEEHIWFLIDRWQEHPDKILKDLAKRLVYRQLPKTVDYDGVLQYQRLYDKAKKLTLAELPYLQSSDDLLKYYLVPDEVRRKTYKPEDAIWMIGEGSPKPLEQDESSQIISAIERQRYFPRLVYPHEIQTKMETQ